MPIFAEVQRLKKIVKKYFSAWLYRRQLEPAAYRRLQEAAGDAATPPGEASADLFTYHGEDGIIQNLLQHLGGVPGYFVDIGSGDCIKSNCSTLAVHEGWKGVFFDADKSNLAIGRRFYKTISLQKGLQFSQAFVSPQNVNGLLAQAGAPPEIGLLSIDIDGNDYWIWEALQARAQIVVIEAKVEFGEKEIVVPYSPQNLRAVDIAYNGASVEALRRLGERKGYTLVAANRYGYNLFFIRREAVKPPLRALSSAEVLLHPDTVRSFYDDAFFSQHSFVRP